MISYNQVLVEMERQLNIASESADEREMREALAAIRSLCEVALGGEVKQTEKVVPKMLMSNNIQTLNTLESKPMVEKDANGGSIFDF